MVASHTPRIVLMPFLVSSGLPLLPEVRCPGRSAITEQGIQPNTEGIHPSHVVGKTQDGTVEHGIRLVVGTAGNADSA